MPTDLERALKALESKQENLNTLWGYYAGVHPMVYANERLREVVKKINAQYVENWCAVVIDTVLDRINLLGFETKDATLQAALSDMWESNDMGLVSKDVHKGALTLGDAFVIVWKNKSEVVRSFYNDSRLCQCFYEPDDPYQMAYAAKWFTDERDSRKHLTLYYADRLEHYIGGEEKSTVTAYEPDPVTSIETNPYGEIPVFRFSHNREGASDIELILPMQNAINKLVSDMMRASEVGAYRQRYAITDADTSKFINAPNEFWTFPAGDGTGQPTQVGEFSETQLANFLDAIDKLANVVGFISRTPVHNYSNSGPISGEALIALEAPLNKKAGDYEGRYKGTWRQVAAFQLKVAGFGDVPSQAIMPKWSPIGTEQPETVARVRQLGIAAGIPLITLLSNEGWSPTKIAQLEKDLATANAQKQTTLANAMVEAQRTFSGGQGAQ